MDKPSHQLIIRTKTGHSYTVNYATQAGANAWPTAFAHWAGTPVDRYQGHAVVDVEMVADQERYVVPFFSIESMEVR